MPIKLSHYSDITSYVTKDGSVIRELMHPGQHGCRLQSLAEATVPVGTKTKLHRHLEAEELYHITSGKGWMTLGNREFEVIQGDTVCIDPGTFHCIENRGQEVLKILCCCSPPYEHNDTHLEGHSD